VRFAYNTNGVQNHRLEDAVELIADAGYDGVALSLDVHHLDPFAPFLPSRALKLGQRLDALGLRTVIETGARFLLDPRSKHEPTLISPDPDGRAHRLDFLRRCVEAKLNVLVAGGTGTGKTTRPRRLHRARTGGHAASP